jgi:DNA relaxase NicK
MSRRASDAAAAKPWSIEPEPLDWFGAKRVGSGVDWISGTTNNSKSSEDLATWTRQVYRSELKLGGIEKGWGLSGFTGFKVGQLEFGMRNDESMVRLMSDCAKFYWRDVYRKSDNVTRLDLQLTYDIGRDPQPFIWNLFAHANLMSAKSKRGPKNDCILGSDGGATLYLGKRGSNVFARVYARGPKTKLDADRFILRFEVQFNKRLALMVTRRIAAMGALENECSAQVVQFIKARTGLIIDGTKYIPNNCLSRSRSDCDKKLLWLQKSVRQSVQLLAERGRLDEVLSALGIQPHVVSTRSRAQLVRSKKERGG